jgi:LPS-assembly lipoprotein
MKKLLFIAALCAVVGACGFRPMYGGGLAPQLASIYVEPVAEREGYELRNTLIGLLGSDGVAKGKTYSLAITLSEANQGVALQNDATITRYNDTLDVSYELSDAKGTVLLRGSQKALSSYNVVASPYATLAAQRDSDKRAAEDVAERIRLDLGAYFQRRP